jgi:hypothetical protein
MSRADRLKWRFPRGSTDVSLSHRKPWPDWSAFEAGHAAFLERFVGALAACGLTDFDATVKDLWSGGHADIHYRAALYGDDEGGAEVVLFQYWGPEYEPVSPSVTLYGSWAAYAEALSAFKDAPM